MNSDRAKFFVLRPARSSDRAFAWTDDSAMAWDTVQCDRFGVLPVRRRTPLVIREIPKIRDSFIWSWFHDILVTTAGKEEITAARLTGCSFSATRISQRRAREVGDTLWEITADGFAGFARRDTMFIREWCCEHEAFSFQVGTSFSELFDRKKWDGSDIFTVWPYPRIVICTARFVDVILSARLTGIHCVPIDEFQLSSNTAAPGIPTESLSAAALSRLKADQEYLDVVLNVCGATLE